MNCRAGSVSSTGALRPSWSASSRATSVIFTRAPAHGCERLGIYVHTQIHALLFEIQGYGDAAFEDYLKRREQTRANAAAYDQQALKGQFDIIYNFGSDMIDDQAIELGTESIKVPGFSQPLVFRKDARYSDMLD